MTPFKLTDELVEEIEQLIESQGDTALTTMLEDVHYADVAEIINELNEEQATYLKNYWTVIRPPMCLPSWTRTYGKAFWAIYPLKKLQGNLKNWIRMML